MKKQPVIWIVFVAVTLSSAQEALKKQGQQPPAQSQGLHFWGEELKPVFGVLQDAQLSGSIGLLGRCDPSSSLPGFPQFYSAPASDSSPLAALREVIARDPGMTVQQDVHGMIRIAEQGVQNDILSVRVSHIVFENYAHRAIHSANFAMEVILSAPEVRSFMEAHNIVAPQFTGARMVPGNFSDDWPPEAPHISGSLDNVTVQEAVDRVLAAFPGEIFVYWDCPDEYEKTEGTHTKAENKRQEEPSRQRTIFVYFFATKKGYGGKTLIFLG